MIRLLFIALVFSLVIPRLAWGAHISGHEETIATKVAHVHQSEHSHEVSDVDATGHVHDSPTSDGTEGLAHNHLPVDVLSVMADVHGPGFIVSFPFPESSHSLDRRGDDAPAEAPDSLLRPPRTT